MDASKPSQLNVAQPQAAVQMSVMNPAAPVNSQQQAHQEHEHKAHRIRGGGAGRDCFLGLVECFICFECCKVSERAAFLLALSADHVHIYRDAANVPRILYAALAKCAAKRS
ncbi:hypothetical protein BV25DRAFT_1782508, partial [Artomyces pyxidatus]